MIKLKNDLCYLKFLNNCFLLLCCFILCYSCNKSQPVSEKHIKPGLNDFFTKAKMHGYDQETTSILILSEEGCMSCNKMFSNLLQCFINKPNAIILISASGTRIDISPFQHDSIKNVLFDESNEFSDLNLVEKSGAIFLHKGQIDTIINIEARNLEEQLGYIKNRIQK